MAAAAAAAGAVVPVAAAAAPAAAGAQAQDNRVWTPTIYLQEIVAAVNKFERYTATVAETVRTYGDAYCHWTRNLLERLREIRPTMPDPQHLLDAHVIICTALLRFKHNLDNDGNAKATSSLTGGFVFGPNAQEVIARARTAFPADDMKPFIIKYHALQVRQFWMRRASDDVLHAIIQQTHELSTRPPVARGPAWIQFMSELCAAKVQDAEAMLQERRMAERQRAYEATAAASGSALVLSSASFLNAQRESNLRNHAAHRDFLVRLRDALPSISHELMIRRLQNVTRQMVEDDLRETSPRAALLALKAMLEANPSISRDAVYEELSAILRSIPHLA